MSFVQGIYQRGRDRNVIRLVSKCTDLEVSVGDAAAVEELEGGCEVADDLGGLGLGEAHPPLDLPEEGAPVGLLEDQVKVVLLLEVLDQLDDVRVPRAQVVDLNLLQDLQRD